MTMPQVPERTPCEAAADVLESIALEEAALAHFINAEAEKIQALARRELTVCEMREFQKAIGRTMRAAIKMQILLEFKLEDIADLIEALCHKVKPDPPRYS